MTALTSKKKGESQRPVSQRGEGDLQQRRRQANAQQFLREKEKGKKLPGSAG